MTAEHSTAKLVLVAGATGGTGRHVVTDLLAAGYRVRALVRDPARARSVFSPAVELAAADVSSPATLTDTLFRDVWAVVSTIGGRAPFGRSGFRAIDWLGNKALIDAARCAHVARFIMVTAGSAGRKTFPHNLPFAPYPWKGRAEEHLKQSGLGYTIIAPGGLTDMPGGQVGVRLAPRDQYRIGRIARADVAAVTVACLGAANTLSRTLTMINDPALAASAWRTQLAS
jgi:uncharacterized protein YbjT (DUF2867 family)